MLVCLSDLSELANTNFKPLTAVAGVAVQLNRIISTKTPSNLHIAYRGAETSLLSVRVFLLSKSVRINI